MKIDGDVVEIQKGDTRLDKLPANLVFYHPHLDGMHLNPGVIKLRLYHFANGDEAWVGVCPQCGHGFFRYDDRFRGELA